MRELLHSRRGSITFATVVALVPLIGFLGLGAEAGSWYVTKWHAQNAADSAAMAGALTIAINTANVNGLIDSQPYDYRGKQFAAQNSFCNAGDTGYPGSKCPSSLPSGITSRTVQVTQLASWNGTNGTFVQATVTQQQSASMAALLGLSTVKIGGTAVAQVITTNKQLCELGLGRWPSSSSGVTLGGSVNITGNGCGIMSNNTVKYASTPTFSGSGWSVNSVSGCIKSGSCDPGVPTNYNSLPTAVPPQLQNLDTASFNSRTGNTSPLTNVTCPASPPAPAGTTNCYSITPNPTGAYKDLTVNGNDWLDFAPGTYFFYNAAIKITGGAVTCTTCTSWTTGVPPGLGVTLVLLGDSSISITGGTVTLSAPKTNTTSADLNGVLIDDQAPNKSKNAITINGSGSVSLGGAMYFPNVDVTWNGTTASSNTTCTEVIGNTLTLGGGAYMSTNGCAPGTVAHTQVVALVQ